ncbi:MAG: sodium:calcium antiporter [Pyrobaculum sp.]
MAEVQLLPSIGPLGLVLGIVLTVVSGILIEQLVHYIALRYKRATSGVAAIFAPLITSSPELAIFAVAILQGQFEIAWGSIVAQPFMAATVIYPFIILTTLGAKLVGRRRYLIPHVHRSVATPLLVFTLPLLPILALHPEKYGAFGRAYGLFLLALYVWYARHMLKEEVESGGVAHLWLRNPVLQTVAAVLAIGVGAEYMVSGIRELGESLGVDKLALSIILVPLATVIPESIVGLIFLAKGKDDEGVSAIVGEKALYSTFYPGLAMALGLYTLEPASILALTLAVVVSIIEVVIVWRYGYFGLSAPVGLLSYVYYVDCFVFGAVCPQIF